MADSIGISSLPDPFKMQTLTMCRNHTVEVPPVPSKHFWAAQNAVIRLSETTSYRNANEKYDRLMPLIKEILNSFPYDPKTLHKNSLSLDFASQLPIPCPDYLLATDLFFLEHRSFFLESLANIVCAVGKDKFVNDYPEVMEAMGPFLALLTAEDWYFCAMLKSCLRLCELMGSDCTLLLIAVRDLSIRALQAGRRYEKFLTVKHYACNFICTWADKQGELFAPHSDEISTAILSTLQLSDGEEGVELTQAAAAALSAVLSILQPKGIEAMRAVWKEYWKTLKRLIKEDPRRELAEAYIRAVRNCVIILRKEGVTVDEMSEMGVMMKEQMEVEKRKREQQIGRGENVAVLEEIAHLFEKIFMEMGTSCCQYLYPVVPLLFPLMELSIDKHWAVLFSTSLIKFAPDMALFYHSQIVQLLFQSLNDEISTNRTSATSAFASLAKNDRPEWKRIAIRSLESLCEMCSRPDARTPEYTFATDNGISSICEILKNCGEIIGRENYMIVISRLLDFLPIREDREEGVHVYGFIADLIEADNQTLLGEPNVNSPRLLAILVKALHYNIFEDTTECYTAKDRLTKIIVTMAEKEDFGEWVQRSQLNEQEGLTLERIIRENFHPLSDR